MLAIGLFLLLVSGLIQECVSMHLMAHFDQKNVQGSVLFSQAEEKTSLNITFHFKSNLRRFENISWKVTQQPVIYDERCMKLGKVLHDFTPNHGYIEAQSFFIDHKMKIIGKNSLLGSSLVLYENSDPIACSTILPHGPVIFATTIFGNENIGASIDFIQKVDGGDTFMYGKVTDSRKSNESSNFDWYISADSNDHMDCNAYTQMYNPTEVSGNCSTNQEQTCKIGDLSSKFGKLSVIEGGTTIFDVDINLPLSGKDSVVSRYLVIKDANGIIMGCSKIKISGPLQVVSKFDAVHHKGISGELLFTQNSPYHFTNVNITFSGLDDRVGPYHVHRFPISDPGNPCSVSSVGGHVNTWNVDPNQSPKPRNGSMDKYEVGDLSGRYGSLEGKTNYTLKSYDANLPLYGLYTILGRSIVIHEKSGARFICSNIEPKDYKSKISTTANFTSAPGSSVVGTVYSAQYIQDNGITTRTVMVVDLKYRSNSLKRTSNHDWYIGTHHIYSGQSCSLPEVYDPTNVTESGECSVLHPFVCEYGALSKKVGQYQVGSKMFFSDLSNPLFGEKTTIGRSIVLSEQNSSAPLSCANMIPDEGSQVLKLSFELEDKTLMKDNKLLQKTLYKGFEFPDAESYRINSVRTSPSASNDSCFLVQFSLIDINVPGKVFSYKCQFKQILNSAEKLHPFRRCADSAAILPSPSQFVLVLLFTLATAMLF